eukprot:gene17279-22813_t
MALYSICIKAISCLTKVELKPSRLRNNIINIDDNTKINDNNNDSDDDKYGRPNIVPFDFAREDVIVKQKISNEKKDEKNEENIPESDTIFDDSSRPTGYNNRDDDDDDNAYRPIIDENDSTIVKIFKDVYVDSPYDSARRRDAKSVFRNITGISLGIGLIFTVVWYAFPGQFISYRGDRDFSVKYRPSIDIPDNILSDEDSTPPPDYDYFQDKAYDSPSINL